jgi:hypothetical protein
VKSDTHEKFSIPDLEKTRLEENFLHFVPEFIKRRARRMRERWRRAAFVVALDYREGWASERQK